MGRWGPEPHAPEGTSSPRPPSAATPPIPLPGAPPRFSSSTLRDRRPFHIRCPGHPSPPGINTSYILSIEFDFTVAFVKTKIAVKIAVVDICLIARFRRRDILDPQ